MNRNLRIHSLALAFAFLAVVGVSNAANNPVLWEIGKADNNNAEFALAPNGHNQFKSDGFFVVGESDSRIDWPYAHPGPDDAWAGGGEHTFSILFGLKKTPNEGECQFQVDLLDTHGRSAPKIRVRINGQDFEQQMPTGAGDETIQGQPAKGKEHKFSIAFPASLLKTGDNEISITSLSGSWMLYDALSLSTPTGAELDKTQSRTLVQNIQTVRALVEKNGKTFQPVTVTLRHYGADAEGRVQLGGAEAVPVRFKSGKQDVEFLAPAVSQETKCPLTIEVNGKALSPHDVLLKPVRKLTVYILPHSHTDIGYTEIQTDIEKKQVQNLVDGIAYARKTASYPEGARFVWNVEVPWAADLYLRRLNEQQRADFFEAVKRGQVVLNGMYLNELTGLCRPEELIRLFRFSTQLAEKTGVPIDSAMISDVPGYTWGTVPAMAQAGIKYFSTAPNYFDRIGTILREWENKPFYWIGPDGKSKVLVWIPFWGYAMSHRYGTMSPKLVEDFSNELEKRNYPYEIAHVRWSGHGDNAVPDPAICEFVKDWNAKYTWPKFIISGTAEAFLALEKRYGDQLPQVRGDWTPYWEDGAGSSAFETALNRQSSERLAQAETLYALKNPAAYPAAAFEDAWNKVLLYSEHTWGADCSVTEPERQKTKEQWEIKKSYADDADKQSRALLEQAQKLEAPASPQTGKVEICNTLSWPRTELAVVPQALSSAGDRVTDDQGKPVPSQRLKSGELAFLVKEIPAFATRPYTIAAGSPETSGKTIITGNVLDNGQVKVRVDEKTGGIVELTAQGLDGNFADTRGGEALNDYLYLPGDDLKAVKHNGPVKISVGENGPLVASLVVESDAPGCKSLQRELRVVAGLDYVEAINRVDKTRLNVKSYMDKEGKESVNFGFPFNVPDGEILLDLPLGAMRPEADQMPSACKNWFSVGRWADVSNKERGITWVTLDAPLLQIGGLTANLLNSQTDPNVWRKKVEPTQKLYSWAMNNHWGTNYRAYQEGLVTFRFILRPHRQADPAEASRFATGFSQPLLAAPSSDKTKQPLPQIQIEQKNVLVSGFKPSDDGKGLIVRLFNASSEPAQIPVQWSKPLKKIWLSDTSERPLKEAMKSISIPAWGLVTLRADLAN
jgi:hypothetical protein